MKGTNPLEQLDYLPPLEEQRFVLRHIARVEALLSTDLAGGDGGDLIDAVLTGAGELASHEWAPTNRIGDTHHPEWRAGEVTMPPRFREAYRAFVEAGWGTISGPQEFGGQGLPHVLAMAVMESFGSANMGFGLCPILTSGAVEALRHHGSPEINERYLARLVSGEWTGTMNLTEPQAGSDVGALRTIATPATDGSWRVKGAKIFITFGEHDLTENIIHLVLARTPDAPAGTRGISLFLVPKFLPDGSRNDVVCTSIEQKLGIHSSPTCAMAFGENDNCHGWLIGNEFGGMRAMFTMMNSARLHIGLQGVQVAERATQLAFSYARDRIQSPRADKIAEGPVAIIEHPDVRRMLTRMAAQTQAIRALVYLAGAEIDRAATGDESARRRLELLTPIAKSHATDVGCEVASLGIQVHGGAGFVETTGAAQHYRDARIAPIYEGTNGIQAADLVERKLIRDDGAAMMELLSEIRESAHHPELRKLTDVLADASDFIKRAEVYERLAASSSFLTMASVAVCGWLMEKQFTAAGHSLNTDPEDAFLDAKRLACAWYLENIVPEAIGLNNSIRNGSRNMLA